MDVPSGIYRSTSLLTGAPVGWPTAEPVVWLHPNGIWITPDVFHDASDAKFVFCTAHCNMASAMLQGGKEVFS